MIKQYKNLFIERVGGNIPILPYREIKEAILGIDYNLNIIYCKSDLSQELNKKYRGKDYPTNILSFPLEENSGEIYIQLQVARRDAKLHNMSYNEFKHLLLIHGCLHLANHDHGDMMEQLEDRYLHKYYKAKNSLKVNEINSIRKHIRD